jgi:hypothetical protein
LSHETVKTKIITMKKVYLSMLSMVVAASVSAQSVNNMQPTRKVTEIGEAPKSTQIQSPAQRNVIWSDDFSTPSNWAFTNTSTPSHGWTVTTNVNAAPYAALNPISTPTAANGYAIVDSDAAGNGSTTNANLTWNGSPINLTGYPNVTLRFYNVSRNWSTEYRVYVSGDNGANWTEYIVNQHITTNINTANPELVSLDISSVAGNQNQVLIRFNMQASWGWFWAVDDVEIMETLDNDLRLNSVQWGSLGAVGVRTPYFQIPVAQIAPITFSAAVENIGVATQTNTMATVDINSGTYTGTSNTVNSAQGQLDTLNVTPAYTPAAAVGPHNVTVTVASDFTDDDPSNNVGLDAFQVTNFIYARDRGNATGGTFNSGDAYEVGNEFDIFANQTIYGINVQIGTASQGSPVIYGKLYSIDMSGFLEERITNDYFVTAAEISSGATITLPFLTPFNAIAGESYLVMVGSYGQPGTNDLVTGTNGTSAPQTSFYLDGTDNTWYYTTSTPCVRMNMDISIGLEELAAVSATLGQNFPNPADNNTTITYSVEESSNIMFEITDLTGKVVFTANQGTQAPGDYQMVVNVEDFASGMYFYTLVANGQKITKKMMVK